MRCGVFLAPTRGNLHGQVRQPMGRLPADLHPSPAEIGPGAACLQKLRHGSSRGFHPDGGSQAASVQEVVANSSTFAIKPQGVYPKSAFPLSHNLSQVITAPLGGEKKSPVAF